jgi:hypothetical protein
VGFITSTVSSELRREAARRARPGLLRSTGRAVATVTMRTAGTPVMARRFSEERHWAIQEGSHAASARGAPRPANRAEPRPLAQVHRLADISCRIEFLRTTGVFCKVEFG